VIKTAPHHTHVDGPDLLDQFNRNARLFHLRHSASAGTKVRSNIKYHIYVSAFLKMFRA